MSYMKRLLDDLEIEPQVQTNLMWTTELEMRDIKMEEHRDISHFVIVGQERYEVIPNPFWCGNED